ncbi:unnamed protein product, partial [Rotaria sp. Silwood1]
FQNEQCKKKQIEKYDEQLKFVSSVQSSEFKAKIVETKTYGEIIENELKKTLCRKFNKTCSFFNIIFT